MVEKSATVTFGAEYRPTTQLLSNIWWRIRASNFLSPIKWLIGQWKDGELNDYEREASPVGASDPLRWWGRHAEKFPVSSDNARRVFVISAASSAEWETLRRSHPIVTAQRNYTVSGKNGTTLFLPLTLPKYCWPIFKIISPTDLAVNF